MAELIIRPNAAGDEANMSPIGEASNYLCVDEASKDDDTTYVENPASGTWKRDLYNMVNHTTEAGVINSVTIHGFCLRGNASGDLVKFAVKSGSTTDEGSQQSLDGATVYTEFTEAWNTNPDTSAAWSWAEIDSIQAGANLYASGVSDPHLTQLWIVVDYTPGWANIAKVNGVTATDLSKVRGIAVASIAKRRGVAV